VTDNSEMEQFHRLLKDTDEFVAETVRHLTGLEPNTAYTWDGEKIEPTEEAE
jgi:hypothetical protein